MTALAGDLQGRRVLVTGASGFLGSHLTRRLVGEGAEVHALVRRVGTSRLADVRPVIAEHEADVTDAAAIISRIRLVRPEAVVHLAADTTSRRFRPGEWAAVHRSIEVNLVGTLHVLRAALESGSVATFVRAGGLEEYGNGATPHDESQREEPVSPYSAGQVAATHFCQMLQQQTDTAIVTLRPALIYGPGQSADFLVPSVIRSCLGGEDFAMSSGVQHRDLLYVDDAVDAFVRAVSTDGLRGAIVDVGHGQATSMRAVAEKVSALIGGPAQIVPGAVPNREGDIAHLLAATDLARRLLNWKPQVGLHEGLERTIAWYRSRGGSLQP